MQRREEKERENDRHMLATLKDKGSADKNNFLRNVFVGNKVF